MLISPIFSYTPCRPEQHISRNGNEERFFVITEGVLLAAADTTMRNDATPLQESLRIDMGESLSSHY